MTATSINDPMLEEDRQLILPPEAMGRLLQVARKLAVTFDLDEMLTEVVEAGTEVLGADRGALWLFDPSSQELVIKVPQLEPAARVEAGQGLVGACMATREIIAVEDCYSDPRFFGAVDKATGYRTRNLLNVPLLNEDQQPIGVMQLLNKQDGHFNQQDQVVAAALAAHCAVALHRAQMTDALLAKERLDEEVSVAREIQISTLPTEMPQVPGYDLHGAFCPASHAGGDLFDLVILNDELFMLLGDATGHGFGPALSATQMQAMLRVAFRLGATLDEAYTQVNNQLAEDLPDDRFITAFAGFLDPVGHEVRFHSGGQGPILHYRATQQDIEWYKPTTFPVGAMEVDSAGEAQRFDMQPGDILGLLSDGVYEYQDPLGKLFGEDRVADILVRNAERSMAEISDAVLAAAREFGAGTDQKDDITVVLVKRT